HPRPPHDDGVSHPPGPRARAPRPAPSSPETATDPVAPGARRGGLRGGHRDPRHRRGRLGAGWASGASLPRTRASIPLPRRCGLPDPAVVGRTAAHLFRRGGGPLHRRGDDGDRGGRPPGTFGSTPTVRRRWSAGTWLAGGGGAGRGGAGAGDAVVRRNDVRRRAFLRVAQRVPVPGAGQRPFPGEPSPAMEWLRPAGGRGAVRDRKSVV